MGLGTITTTYDGHVVESNGNPPTASQHEAAVISSFQAVPPDMEVNLNGITTNWDSVNGPQTFEVTHSPNSQTLAEWERHWIATWRAKSAAQVPV